MLSLTLKLLLAHIIGDFLLQPTVWVKHKEKYKYKSKYLYFHILIHLLALLIVLEFDWHFWPVILSIIISHYFIDLGKLLLTSKYNKLSLFVADQFLHIAVIGIVVYAYYPTMSIFSQLLGLKSLLLINAVFLVTTVSSIILKNMMGMWKMSSDKPRDSLKNAGMYIGILERLFVFGFVIIGQWQAIGFLLASKSVFRFGDLSRAKDRKLTEYILIGTLLSFGLAILFGLTFNYLNNQL